MDIGAFMGSGEMTVEDGYILANTDMLIELMAQGYTITLPEVELWDEAVSNYTVDELSHVGLSGDMNDIVSIEYVGEEEVQCIAIEDEDHLYLTDGFIPTHNTSNIIFLKSTDDSMLDTLEKMSGKRHTVYRDTETITEDLGRIVMKNEDKRTVTLTSKEEAVITYNDLAFLSERNSIVFRAGDSPIWNRNELVLPMSWRLFSNKIVHPGHDYTLQTIPTLSSAIDFDVRQNQPNFEAMVNKRMIQALYADEAAQMYKDAYGYDDYQVERLDPDVYSDAVMDIIEAKIAYKEGRDRTNYIAVVHPEKHFGKSVPETEVNQEQIAMTKQKVAEQRSYSLKRYADGMIAQDDLAQFDEGGVIINVNHNFDEIFVDVFKEFKEEFARDSRNFTIRNGSLMDSRGMRMFIERAEQTNRDTTVINMKSRDQESRVYVNDGRDLQATDLYSYTVTDAWYRYLVSFDSWKQLCGGRFDMAVKKRIMADE